MFLKYNLIIRDYQECDNLSSNTVYNWFIYGTSNGYYSVVIFIVNPVRYFLWLEKVQLTSMSKAISHEQEN